VAGNFNHLFPTEHAWLGTEAGTELLVVQARSASHHYDHGFLASAQTYAFGNLIRLYPVCGSSQRNRRGTGFGNDYFDVWRALREKGLDRKETHVANIAHESFLSKPYAAMRDAQYCGA
jgi:hypothetical protein